MYMQRSLFLLKSASRSDVVVERSRGICPITSWHAKGQAQYGARSHCTPTKSLRQDTPQQCLIDTGAPVHRPTRFLLNLSPL